MAIFNIKSINYVITGNKEKLINADIECNNNIKNITYVLDIENDNMSYSYLDYNKNLIYNSLMSSIIEIPELENIKADIDRYDDYIISTILNYPISVALSIDFIKDDIYDYINIYCLESNSIMSNSLSSIMNENNLIFFENSLKYLSSYAQFERNSILSSTVQDIIYSNEALSADLEKYILDYIYLPDSSLYSFSKGRNTHGLRRVGTSNIIRNIYDFKDVMIKSAIATRLIYTDRDQKSSNNIDIYLPHQIDNPYSFCQIQGYAYGVTRPVVAGPIMERTNILLNRYQNVTFHTNRPTYSYWLNSDNNTYNPFALVKNKAPGYFYIPLKYLVGADGNKPKSLFGYIKSFKDLSVDMISSLYMPKFNFIDVHHNYIVEMPVNDSYKTEYNDYNKGIVLGDIIGGKTMYDSTYCESLDKVGELKRTRKYCDIGACGGSAFLKYYDDAYVEPNENEINNLTTSLSDDVKTITMKPPVINKLSHQKVEIIKSINRFLASAKHKSNLYSVKIHNLQLDTLEASDDTKFKIRNDIENSIRHITDYLAPAHTQLFHVEYVDD